MCFRLRPAPHHGPRPRPAAMASWAWVAAAALPLVGGPAVHADLIHRYSFSEGGGTAVADSIGGADGEVLGAGFAWNGDGTLTLGGGASSSAAYVDLPNGLISGLESVTVEGWVTVETTQNWARIFDFGDSGGSEVVGPGGGAAGSDYLVLTASRGTNAGQQRLEMRDASRGVTSTFDIDHPGIVGVEQYFAVTFAADPGGGGTLTYYRDGEAVTLVTGGTSGTSTIDLADINDVNNWLGRSNWTADANLHGTFNEVRIYDEALGADTVGESFAAGPDEVATLVDSDSDGLPDQYENRFAFLSPDNPEDAALDQDGDGLSNLGEYLARTNPEVADTDGDGLSDGAEVNRQAGGEPAPTNPLAADTDGDTLGDGAEVNTHGTDPLVVDTDGDTFWDNAEVFLGSDPLLAGSVPGQTLLVQSNSGGESWETGAAWNNGTPAAAGQDYVVVGGLADVLQTPGGALATFPGDSLSVVGAGSRLRLRAERNVVADLRLDGATIEHAIASTGEVTLEGRAQISGATGIELPDMPRVLAIRSTLSGDGAVAVSRPAGNPAAGTVVLRGVGGSFSGAWTVDSATLHAVTPGSLGTGDIALVDATLDADYNINSPGATLSLRGTITVVLDQTHLLKDVIVIQPGAGPGGEDRLIAISDFGLGTYTAQDFVDLGFDPVNFPDLGGSITVLGEGGGGDGDNLPDNWETDNFGDLAQGDDDDPDGDGATNLIEFAAGTDPNNPDSDGDGLTDGDEINLHGSDPNLADTDGDGVGDADEVNRTAGGAPAPTDPRNPDTDGDGLLDAVETGTGVFADAADTGSDPLLADSDGDGFADGVEVGFGSDPNRADDRPRAGPPGLVAAGELFVNLDAAGLADGDLASWTNFGASGGEFANATEVLGASSPQAGEVAGARAVTFDGDDGMIGPLAPAGVVGPDPTRSVEVWAYNPDIPDEEVMVSWSRRGGPDGSALQFNYGSHANFGAVTHWGGNFHDMSWTDNTNTVAGSPAPDEWHHLVYTYDGTTTRAYADGRLQNEEVLGASAVTTHDGHPFRLAHAVESDGAASLMGSLSLAQVRVHDGVLDPEAIVTNYNLSAEAFGRTPLVVGDLDEDGLPDLYEIDTFGATETQTGADDNDGDGLSNLGEFNAGTDPLDPDSDGDGAPDGAEVNRTVDGTPAPTDPLDPDSDNDGLPDGVETGPGGVFVDLNDTGTDPLAADTDGDGTTDFSEVRFAGTDPNDAGSFPDVDVVAAGTLFINLDAQGLPDGPLRSWTNTGQTAGDFYNAPPGLLPASDPVVEVIEGVRAVTFDGNDGMVGPLAPAGLVGPDPTRSVEVWAYNPQVPVEEVMVAWSRRGGPDGSAVQFNYGDSSNFGAVTHWGGNLHDMSWTDNTNSVPGSPAEGAWHHLVYTYDGTTTRAYADGTLQNEETLGAGAVTTHDGFPIRLAHAQEDTGAASLMGSLSLAVVRVHDDVLSLDDVINNFIAGVTGTVAAQPGADRDGDGIPDLLEMAVGTDPNDPNSVFQVRQTPSIVRGGGGTIESFGFTVPGGAGAVFNIEFKADLTDPDWTLVGTLAGGQEFTDDDPARLAGATGIYRVVLAPVAAAP